MLEQYLSHEQHQIRRSKMETMCDILATIAAGTERPTHIMYKANLSWKIMQNYMKSLESQGLIVLLEDQGRRLYRLSEKGFRLLGQINSVRDGLLIETKY
jgi:predicted transcriptional regulator